MSGVVFAEDGGAVIQSRRWGLSAAFQISYDAQSMPVLDVSTSPGADHDIDEHNDANMSGLAEGQFIARNGSSQWVNRDLTAADIQSGTLAIARGGTNLGSYVQGDILYASAANVLSALAVPVLDGWVLTYDSGTDLPEWRAPDVGTVFAEDVGGTNDSERTFEVDGKYTFQNALDVGGAVTAGALTATTGTFTGILKRTFATNAASGITLESTDAGSQQSPRLFFYNTNSPAEGVAIILGSDSTMAFYTGSTPDSSTGSGRMLLSATALSPASSGGITLGSSGNLWGAAWVGALTATAGTFTNTDTVVEIIGTTGDAELDLHSNYVSGSNDVTTINFYYSNAPGALIWATGFSSTQSFYIRDVNAGIDVLNATLAGVIQLGDANADILFGPSATGFWLDYSALAVMPQTASALDFGSTILPWGAAYIGALTATAGTFTNVDAEVNIIGTTGDAELNLHSNSSSGSNDLATINFYYSNAPGPLIWATGFTSAQTFYIRDVNGGRDVLNATQAGVVQLGDASADILFGPSATGFWLDYSATIVAPRTASALDLGSASLPWGAAYIGDLIFVGTAGLAIGEIWVEDNAVETAIGVAGTWVQVTVFDTNGASNNTNPDHTNDHITITVAGFYKIQLSATILSGAGLSADYECEARVNNGATAFKNIHFHRQMAGGGGDIGAAPAHGYADLAVNDTVEVWVRNVTNTTNLTFANITLTVEQKTGT